MFPASEFLAARPLSISLTRCMANSQLSPLSARLLAMLSSARLIALCITPQGTSSSPVTLSLTRGGPICHMNVLFLILMTRSCCLSPLLPHHPLLLLPCLILPLPLPLHSLLFHPRPLPLPLTHSPRWLPRVPSVPFARPFRMMTRTTQLCPIADLAPWNKPTSSLQTRPMTHNHTTRPWHAVMPPSGMWPAKTRSATSSKWGFTI